MSNDETVKFIVDPSTLHRWTQRLDWYCKINDRAFIRRRRLSFFFFKYVHIQDETSHNFTYPVDDRIELSDEKRFTITQDDALNDMNFDIVRNTICRIESRAVTNRNQSR